jgi:hypothetical protein
MHELPKPMKMSELAIYHPIMMKFGSTVLVPLKALVKGFAVFTRYNL